MDTNELLSKLSKAIPGAVLEKQRFGRSGTYCIWIETRAICEVADILKTHENFRFNWLENLCVMQMDDALVLSYFLRSNEHNDALILRTSIGEVVTKKGSEKEAESPSVSDIWPMASPMEMESSELFGIQFRDRSGEIVQRPFDRLSKGFVQNHGYPMRKGRHKL